MASRAAQVARRIVETQAALSPQHVSALLRMSSESSSLLEKRAREAPTTLVPLVGAYSQAGRFDDALRVLREAAREEARPLLVRAYEPLLVGCVRSNDDGALWAELRALERAQAGVARARRLQREPVQQMELCLIFFRRAAWPAGTVCGLETHEAVLARVRSGELLDVEQPAVRAATGAAGAAAPGVIALEALPRSSSCCDSSGRHWFFS